jgi:hypothetical protein
MLEPALPIRLSSIADTPVVPARAAYAKTLFRDLRDRFLRLLRFLGEFLAKGGALS